MSAKTPTVAGPGFVAIFFDIPFPISIPNGCYLSYDPEREIASVTVTLREGSRAFFRNKPIIGPTSFEELRAAEQDFERPRENYSYLAASRLKDGTSKATLNVHSGFDGGFAECKYYSEVCVTFLTDNIAHIGQDGWAMGRACQILNPFLDKYRLFNEDYRISAVSMERNFYFATCHTSPLTSDEAKLSSAELFHRLQIPRVFLQKLGLGASNVLRTNSLELLGPRSPLDGDMLRIFTEFIKEQYEMPLSYDLILDAIRYLQRFRDYRLAIVHAETAFEVHVLKSLLALLIESGMTDAQALSEIETQKTYWGVKNKLRRLDEHTAHYCKKAGTGCTSFMGSSLATKWESALYKKRNAAVHAGSNTYTYNEASAAIGVAKESIVFFESRLLRLQNRIQLNSSMAGFRQNPGEVMF